MAVHLPRVKFREVPGTLSGVGLRAALMAQYSLADLSGQRFHLDEPLHEHDTTWVISTHWNDPRVRAAIHQLADVAPPDTP